MLAVGDEARAQAAVETKAGGKSHGGARAGSGNKPGNNGRTGVKNALPKGCVAAVRAAGMRIPKDAPVAHRNLADRALERIADVMEDKVSSFTAFAVLTAARTLREEVCGPIPKRTEVSGPGGAPLEFTVKEV